LFAVGNLAEVERRRGSGRRARTRISHLDQDLVERSAIDQVGDVEVEGQITAFVGAGRLAVDPHQAVVVDRAEAQP
jgi:hypothetical protein